MLDVEDWAEILRLHVGEGMPQDACLAACLCSRGTC